MIGRGALNVPNLSRVVKYNEPRMAWPDVVTFTAKIWPLEKQGDTGLYHVARIKQWLSYLRKEYSEALGLFQEIRTLQTSADIARVIQSK
jgi:tRNA-dihydrouridine synthase C